MQRCIKWLDPDLCPLGAVHTRQAGQTCLLLITHRLRCMNRTLRTSSLLRWQQVAAALLVGVLCVQVMPLQVVQQAPSAHHHQCAERGFCPRNPGGPCTCDHHAPTSEHDRHAPTSSDTTPSLRSCGTTTDAPLLLNSGLVKGVSSVGTSTVIPTRSDRWSGAPDLLTPQRHAADIFRPPKSHLG